jgi:voltage-gated potassium channel
MIPHRSLFLLIALVLLLFTVPVASFIPVDTNVAGHYLVTALFVLTLAAAAATIGTGWKAVAAAILLAVPAAILQGLGQFMPSDSMLIAEYCLSLAFIGFTIYVMLRATLTSPRVTFDTICAALSVYLLFGVLWAIAYSLLDIVEPGASFHNALGAESEEPMRFGTGGTSYPLYFSFVTMTTLGYGDIVPNSPAARMLAAAQAVLGQFYMAVLLARFVALQVADSRRNRAPPSS